MKLFIDCDPGVDDTIAILYALNQQDVEIVGISTGTGNTSAAQGAENALRVLKLAGYEETIPVCIGRETTLNGERPNYPTFIHGNNGLGNVELPQTDQKPVEQDVCDFIYQKACENCGDLVLVTLGRFTNVALTLQKYPDFAKKIKRVVSMGGTIYAPGNVQPVVEANIGGDPEAADIAFMADWDLTLVGLDVTAKTHLTREDIDKLLCYCKPEKRNAVQLISEILLYYMDGSLSQNYTMDYSPLHDPLAMLAAIHPSVVTTRSMITRVECSGVYCRGRVITDLREQPIEGRYVRHCIDVDSRYALNLLLAAFHH